LIFTKTVAGRMLEDNPAQRQSQGQGDPYYQQQGNPQIQQIPEMARMGSREYSESHYKFLSTLIESESARTFFKQIAETDFSHQCVNAFYKVLTSGFDKNAILAMNDKIEIRKIDFDIALNLMVLECHESDIQNPAFLTFRENIRQTFVDFISRSRNAEERKRLLRSEFGQTITEEQKQQKPQGIKEQVSRFGRVP
jgi:hypothetical protein